MKRIVILPAARDDLRRERDYYERRRASLGRRFTQEARHATERIAEAPEAMQVVKHNIRRWPVRGFPHGVLYRIEARRIVVTAVFHPSLHPDKWSDRK